MKKILLTGVDFYSPNRGVGALSYGAISCLLRKEKNIEFGLWNTLGFGGSSIEKQKIKDFEEKLPFYQTNIFYSFYMLFLSFLVKILPKTMKPLILQASSYLRELAKYDFVVDLSLGDSFSDFYTWKRAILNSLTKFIPYNLGQPIYMFPQTIGPFRTKFGTAICKKSINLVDKVYAREEISYKVTSKLLKDKSKLLRAADMAFLVKPDENYNINFLTADEKCKYVGINISGLLYNDKRRFEILKKEFDYKLVLKEIINSFLSNGNTKIVLIPHVYSFKNDLPNFYDDLRAIKDFKSGLPEEIKEKVILIENDLDCKELKKIISSMDFFIGSRMHACIGALSTNVPSALISYSYKFKGVLKKLGVMDLECNPKILSEKEIIEKINMLYEKRGSIKSKLIPSNVKMKESAYSCSNILN